MPGELTRVPSPAELISAFVKDLSDLLDSQRPVDLSTTRHVVLTSGTGTNASWKLDADYFFIGLSIIGAGGNTWSLNTDNRSSATPGIGTVEVDTVLYRAVSLTGNLIVSGLKTPLNAGSTLYFVNGTAFTQVLNVFLQRR